MGMAVISKASLPDGSPRCPSAGHRQKRVARLDGWINEQSKDQWQINTYHRANHTGRLSGSSFEPSKFYGNPTRQENSNGEGSSRKEQEKTGLGLLKNFHIGDNKRKKQGHHLCHDELE
jgi:hypothetical protein